MRRGDALALALVVTGGCLGLRRTRPMARLGYRGLLGLTAVTDRLPARIRFGHWQQVLSLLRVGGGLPVVPRPATPARPFVAGGVGLGRSSAEPSHNCMLIAGSLDGGGVESVISTLALGLPAEGFGVEVVTTQAGRVGQGLAAAGVRVTTCPVDAVSGLIAEHRPDVVELHRPDLPFVSQALDSAVPVVPVLHAMESYLDAATWTALGELVSAAPSCIAVSEGVRGFFEQHIEGSRISVVVNGVPPLDLAQVPDRQEARRRVGASLGTDIDAQDIVVVALQRYSDQKNAAGLVDAFLAAAHAEPRMLLVLAGSADSWLEYRRADLLRRGSQLADRVHLLGDSDSPTILAAGDLYALDSFAEGGPLTALEAVLHGLPVVLSDVGFAGDLVRQGGVVGEVVDRANSGFTEGDLAMQRRRRHQSNRDQFAGALLRTVSRGRGTTGQVPASFTRETMIAGHAEALRTALASGS